MLLTFVLVFLAEGGKKDICHDISCLCDTLLILLPFIYDHILQVLFPCQTCTDPNMHFKIGLPCLPHVQKYLM